jgi:hypothetical protein
VTAGDAAAEDQREFVGLTDGAIGIEEPLLESIDGGATTEDQIVAVLYLRKKQAVLNTGVLSLFGSEKGDEAGQPLLSTADHLVGMEGIGEFLKSLRIGTLPEGVGALLKTNARLLQAQSQPVMLIETDARGEREMRTDPHKHLSPTGVLDIEVVLLDPAPLHFQMPTIVLPDGGHDRGGLAGFDDGHDLVGLRTSEIALHEIIASAGGIFLNGYTPFLRTVFGPVVILRGDVAQQLPTHGIDLPIAPEKAHGSLFLLKGPDHGMEQDTIEATISETDVILMVFIEGVHGVLQWGEILGAYPSERLSVLCLSRKLRHELFRISWCGARRTNWC